MARSPTTLVTRRLLAGCLIGLLALELPLPAYALRTRPAAEVAGTTDGLEEALEPSAAGLEEGAEAIVAAIQRRDFAEAARWMAQGLQAPLQQQRYFLWRVQSRLDKMPLPPELLAALEPEAFDALLISAYETQWKFLTNGVGVLMTDRDIARKIAERAVRWLAPQAYARELLGMIGRDLLPVSDRLQLLHEQGAPPLAVPQSLDELLETVRTSRYGGRLVEPIALEGWPGLYVVGDHDMAYPILKEAQIQGRVPRQGLVMVNWDWSLHDDGARAETIQAFETAFSKHPSELAEFQRLANSPDRAAGWEIRSRWLGTADFLKGLAADGSVAHLIHVMPPGIDDVIEPVIQEEERDVVIAGHSVRISRIFPNRLPELLATLQPHGQFVETIDLDHFLSHPGQRQAMARPDTLQAFAKAQQAIVREGVRPTLRIVALSSPAYTPAETVPPVLQEVLAHLPTAGLEEPDVAVAPAVAQALEATRTFLDLAA